MKFLLRAVLCLLAVTVPAYAARGCVAGNATGTFPLETGYTFRISAGEGAHAGTCRATVDGGPTGTLLDLHAYQIMPDEFSGKDVTNDGQPDLIIYGRIAKDDPLTYWIVSFAEPAGVARQLTVVYPLSFEDRDGDGKMEIWTREWSYDGIDGLSSGESPHPPVALRLVGHRLSYVSHQFPLEYEAEITQARQRITEDGVKRFKNLESTGMEVQKERAGAKDKPDPRLDAKAYEARLGILEVATLCIYAGKTTEAMQALGDWPYNDRDRIRTLIIRQRANGIMRQLNAPQPLAPKHAATQPAPSSSPQ